MTINFLLHPSTRDTASNLEKFCDSSFRYGRQRKFHFDQNHCFVTSCLRLVFYFTKSLECARKSLFWLTLKSYVVFRLLDFINCFGVLNDLNQVQQSNCQKKRQKFPHSSNERVFFTHNFLYLYTEMPRKPIWTALMLHSKI